MILFKRSPDLKEFLLKNDRSIGFVPTMGALHKGHLELIAESRRRECLTVCSIFVNPAQFNDHKDFEKYPNTIDSDILMLEQGKTDILFLPEVKEIYPKGFEVLEHYELGYLETVLEGKFRPGHFQGVCQVMSRLLDIIEPEQLFMGEKDLQQCLVVRNLLNLRFPQVHFHKCPTLREKDGLAMSSRNLRLSPEERSQAPALPRALNFIRDNIEKMGWKNARLEASNRMSAAGFRLDYLELARSQDLSIKDAYEAVEDLVVLVAAFLGSVRLIDNLPLAAKH